MEKLFIGAVFKATNVPRKTIRYYEELGLIKPVRRTRGGFRVYDETVIPMLRFIRHAQRLGFSLKEIRQVLSVWRRTGRTCETVQAIAQRKLEQLDKLLQRLTALREHLFKLTQALKNPDGCEPHSPEVCVFIMDALPLDEFPLRLPLPFPLAQAKPSKRRRRRRQKPSRRDDLWSDWEKEQEDDWDEWGQDWTS